MFLFNPFRGKTDVPAAAARRTRTVNALYRVLSEEFERARSCECSCKLPMVVQCDARSPDEPNWQVESLWCGCRECRQALAEIIARNAPLYRVKERPAEDDEAIADPG